MLSWVRVRSIFQYLNQVCALAGKLPPILTAVVSSLVMDIMGSNGILLSRYGPKRGGRDPTTRRELTALFLDGLDGLDPEIHVLHDRNALGDG